MLKRTREYVGLALETKYIPCVALLLLASVQLTGCSVVKGIFKAGVWVGALGVIAVIGLIVYGITRFGRRG